MRDATIQVLARSKECNTLSLRWSPTTNHPHRKIMSLLLFFFFGSPRRPSFIRLHFHFFCQYIYTANCLLKASDEQWYIKKKQEANFVHTSCHHPLKTWHKFDPCRILSVANEIINNEKFQPLLAADACYITLADFFLKTGDARPRNKKCYQ